MHQMWLSDMTRKPHQGADRGDKDVTSRMVCSSEEMGRSHSEQLLGGLKGHGEHFGSCPPCWEFCCEGRGREWLGRPVALAGEEGVSSVLLLAGRIFCSFQGGCSFSHVQRKSPGCLGIVAGVTLFMVVIFFS